MTIRTSDDGLISSDPDIHNGRWCVAGTRMPVATVQVAVREGGIAGFRRVYHADHISDAQIAACVAWSFPAICDVPDLELEDGTLRCVCGEWDVNLHERGRYDCPWCAKRWRVTVTVEAV